MQTIGKYYNTTLQYINDGTKSEFFVTPVSNTMDCTALEANRTTLEKQLIMWNDKVLASGNRTEIANLSRIIEIQTAKLEAYEAAINSKCGINNTGGGGNGLPIENDQDGIHQNPLPAEGDNKPNVLLYAGLALLVIFLLKK